MENKGAHTNARATFPGFISALEDAAEFYFYFFFVIILYTFGKTLGYAHIQGR